MMHSKGAGTRADNNSSKAARDNKGIRASSKEISNPSRRLSLQSIEKGMTPDQVEAAKGKPEKIVNLGPKKIYVYKDLKVTFLNGKVFDVQ